MPLEEHIYRRTHSGDEAIVKNDPAIPGDYRRILRLIEGNTHSDVIRGRLRQFPDALLADWLAELEELGYLTSAPADVTQDLDFTALFRAKARGNPKPAPEDVQRIENQTQAASMDLEHKGSFLSPDRLKNREPLATGPGDITVLIVEDDPDQAALADLRVSMAGYKVRIARDRRELLEDLRTNTLPDLVLLDIKLPDGNGFDILRSMREHPRLALLPVVMLTVMIGQANVRNGISLGADGYITKPYSKRILADTIRAVLKHA